jgi:uncharacterized protein (TIGR03790 family)
MRLRCTLGTLVFAAALFPQSVPQPVPQSVPLKDRVLILVNDRVRESVSVGQYYAAKRNIPTANILHLKTLATEEISQDEFKDQIENPVRKFLDAGGGAMRKKILYIVPTYGVPVKIAQQFAVDSVLVMMYAGHENDKPPLRNPYAAPTGSRPPHFDVWSDTVAAANNFKMFVVTRLDGPSAEIAKGLVDKAIQAETSLTMTSGIAYFDSQGTRHPEEWQFAIDAEIKAASELSRKAGFNTVLNVQAGTLCGSNFPPPPQYFYDAAKQRMGVNALGATAAAAFSFPPVPEGDFTFLVAEGGVQNTGNSITLTLGSASDKSRVRLFYPFVPYKRWDISDEIVLEKTVDGAVAARIAVPTSRDEKLTNQFGALRLSVRKTRLAAYRDGVEIAAVGDTSGKPLNLEKASLSANCWGFNIKGLTVTDAAGAPVWDDKFSTDSTARYQWQTSPRPGLNALWVWGWYGMAFDAYRFVPGAVGAQLTSFTADRIRTPLNADPKMYSVTAARWGGNWVPRMLEQGVTATWGAITEPYAIYYAPGGNVFDHLWAGYNFGDSFYIAQNAVRWVMVAVGDPLYSPRPFARPR